MQVEIPTNLPTRLAGYREAVRFDHRDLARSLASVHIALFRWTSVTSGCGRPGRRLSIARRAGRAAHQVRGANDMQSLIAGRRA